MRGREQLVSLKPCGRGIVLETMRYEDEVRAAQGYFREIPDTKPEKPLLDLATTLIDQRTDKFDPAKFHDHYIEALHRIIEKKAKSKGKQVLEDVEEPGDTRGSNVIDLMAALKRSVGGGGSGGEDKAPKSSGGKKAPAKKTAAKKTPAPKAAPARKRA